MQPEADFEKVVEATSTSSAASKREDDSKRLFVSQGEAFSNQFCRAMIKASPCYYIDMISKVFKDRNSHIRFENKNFPENVGYSKAVLLDNYDKFLNFTKGKLSINMIKVVLFTSFMAVVSMVAGKFAPDSLIASSWVNIIISSMIFLTFFYCVFGFWGDIGRANKIHSSLTDVIDNSSRRGDEMIEFPFFKKSFQFKMSGVVEFKRDMLSEYSLRDLFLFDGLGINLLLPITAQKNAVKDVFAMGFYIYGSLVEEYIEKGYVDENGKALVDYPNSKAFEFLQDLYNENLSFSNFDFYFNSEKYSNSLSKLVVLLEEVFINELSYGGKHRHLLSDLLKECKDGILKDPSTVSLEKSSMVSSSGKFNNLIPEAYRMGNNRAVEILERLTEKAR